MNKNKINKIVVTLILVLVIGFVLFIGINVYSDFKEEDILKSEVERYMELSLENDDFDIEIKSSGDYAVVEEIIKNYFKDLSIVVKEISTIENDKDFVNILTVDNFKSDGPKFNNTLDKISNVKSSINDNFNKFIELSSRDYIISLIDDESDLDEYYRDLYKDIMLDDSEIESLEEIKVGLEDTKNEFGIFLDNCENIILFLKNNSGKWLIEDDSVVFENNDLLDEYNNLKDKLLNNSEF